MWSSVALRRHQLLHFPSSITPLSSRLLRVDSPTRIPRRFSSDQPHEDSRPPSIDSPEPLTDSAEKPKIRKPRISVASSKEPEPVELPGDLDILWTPQEEQPNLSALPHPENFEDALNKLLITLHPQTQHRATYSTSLGVPTEPTLALYSPIEGGDYIIDATVTELARRTGAEVLVLDAVQLAAGEWGHFGSAANSLSLPRNPLHFSSPSSTVNLRPSVDEEDDLDSPAFPPRMAVALVAPPSMQGRTIIASAQRRPPPPSKVKVFFDTVVNTLSKADSRQTSQKNRPRLIYIRDFPTLAPSSSSWYPPLLSAVRERRRGPISRPSSPVSNPMTIIFGLTPSLTPPESQDFPSGGLVNMLTNRSSSPAPYIAEPKPGKVDWGEDEAAEKAREQRLRERLKKWENADAALVAEFPKLSTPEDHENGPERPEIVLLGSLGSYGFPGFSSNASSSTSGNSQNSSFFRTSILIPRVRNVSDERVARMSRRREINELTHRMGIGAAGGFLDQESAISVHEHSSALDSDSTPSAAPAESNGARMWDDWGNRVEIWSNVRRIADQAIGNTIAAAGIEASSESSLAATTVLWSTVHNAWVAHRASNTRRSSWLKEAFSIHKTAWETDHANDDSKQENRERPDEVIERVKNEADLDTHEQRLLGCIVDAISMPTSFDQVHLPSHTIDSVRTIVSLPLLQPDAFQHGILKQHGITGCLLFGPPGTGKTLVVRALAKEAGCRMLSISPSDVMDMYVGEGEKLVKAVFSLARRLSPCVVFLDEIDALFGARMSSRETGSSFAHRGIITEFMQEMDGLKSSREDSVIVIGATNRPFDLDDAVLRRLPRRLLVDLPGEKEREEILKILLRDEMLASDLDIRVLSKKTENFSGSDLKHLCVSAALDAVKEDVSLPWTSRLSPDTAASESSPPPTDVDTDASIPEGNNEVQLTSDPEPSVSVLDVTLNKAESRKRILHVHHFAKALKEITPSSSESLGSLSELRKWNDEFGEGRRKKKRQHWGKDRFGFTSKPSQDLESGKVIQTSQVPSNTVQVEEESII